MKYRSDKRKSNDADAQRNDFISGNRNLGCATGTYVYAQSNSVFHVNTQRSSAPETVYQRTQ